MYYQQQNIEQWYLACHFRNTLDVQINSRFEKCGFKTLFPLPIEFNQSHLCCLALKLFAEVWWAPRCVDNWRPWLPNFYTLSLANSLSMRRDPFLGRPMAISCIRCLSMIATLVCCPKDGFSQSFLLSSSSYKLLPFLHCSLNFKRNHVNVFFRTGHSTITLCLSLLSIADIKHCPKTTQAERIFGGLHFHIAVQCWGVLRQELKQTPGGRISSRSCPRLLLISFLLLACSIYIFIHPRNTWREGGRWCHSQWAESFPVNHQLRKCLRACL